MLILPGSSASDSLKLTERFRRIIESCEFQVDDQIKIHATMSFGIADCPNEKINNELKLIQKADEALYKAKEAGRNCIKL